MISRLIGDQLPTGIAEIYSIFELALTKGIKSADCTDLTDRYIARWYFERNRGVLSGTISALTRKTVYNMTTAGKGKKVAKPQETVDQELAYEKRKEVARQNATAELAKLVMGLGFTPSAISILDEMALHNLQLEVHFVVYDSELPGEIRELQKEFKSVCETKDVLLSRLDGAKKLLNARLLEDEGMAGVEAVMKDIVSVFQAYRPSRHPELAERFHKAFWDYLGIFTQDDDSRIVEREMHPSIV